VYSGATLSGCAAGETTPNEAADDAGNHADADAADADAPADEP